MYGSLLAVIDECMAGISQESFEQNMVWQRHIPVPVLCSADAMVPSPRGLETPGTQEPVSAPAHHTRTARSNNKEKIGNHGPSVEGVTASQSEASDQVTWSVATNRKPVSGGDWPGHDHTMSFFAPCSVLSGPEYKDSWAWEIHRFSWAPGLAAESRDLGLGWRAVWVGSWVTPSRVTRVLWSFVTWHPAVTSVRDHDDDVISTHYGEILLPGVQSSELSVDCGARISSQSQLSRVSRDGVTHISWHNLPIIILG